MNKTSTFPKNLFIRLKQFIEISYRPAKVLGKVSQAKSICLPFHRTWNRRTFLISSCKQRNTKKQGTYGTSVYGFIEDDNFILIKRLQNDK
jgi:hypothetical protein